MRPLKMLGVALVAFFVIRFVFGGIFHMVFSVGWLALKVLVAAGIVYWLISVFSPATAAKLRGEGPET